MSDYDYIVVGAGSSGCVIAARLSEDPATSVLLVEAGGEDTNPDIHVPANAWSVWMTADDWGYTTVPQPGAANRSLYLPRGKVLGGSSSLNAMIYIRGNRTDYDTWAYLGNPGWDYASVLPYFKKSEDYHGGASPYHGTGGPLTVSTMTPNPLTEAFIDAALGVAQRYQRRQQPEHGAKAVERLVGKLFKADRENLLRFRNQLEIALAVRG